MKRLLRTAHRARTSPRPFRALLSAHLAFLVLACAVFPLTGCGASLQKKRGPEILSAGAVANLIRVPLTRQSSDYTCGVAAMQSMLYYLDEKDDYSEEVLMRELRADPEKGTSYRAMADFARSKGYRVEIRTGMRLDDLRGFIDGGKPVIVLIQAWAESPVDYSKSWEEGHYVVAIGYDRDNVYFMDPSILGNYAYLSNREFTDRWHDEDAGIRLEHFGMVVTKEDRGKLYEPDRLHRIR